MNTIPQLFKMCNKCGQMLPLSAFSINCTTKDKHTTICAKCVNAKHIPKTNYITNKTCATHLGVYVAERLLSKVFKNVKTMPPNNPGYDFICNHGKKIDVKSACVTINSEHNRRWRFGIKYNKKADYFLCIAIDNRVDLKPLYLWLIPGEIVNHQATVSISEFTLGKWSEYKIDIERVNQCFESMV